jgi:CDP-paratose 2-epimerase
VTTLLVTGGCGLVGSHLALALKADNPKARVVALDNLSRRGAELALARLAAGGVAFVHGDIRKPEDLDAAGPFDLLIDCAAEPSVHAGYGGDPRYLVGANLTGTLNCLEATRRHKGALILLSTSRVYPIAALRSLPFREGATRLELEPGAEGPGWSRAGIALDFPLSGPRSLYGGTKLSGEIMAEEYAATYDMPVIVNRCGILTGPWQMGKVDQGVIALWVAAHLYGLPLRYMGFGGTGLQVRDMLHVSDLFALLRKQVATLSPGHFGLHAVGGGAEVSVSLQELTALCAERTGREISFSSEPETRAADIPWFITDATQTRAAFDWEPQYGAKAIVEDMAHWIEANRVQLAPVFGAIP